MAQQTQVNDVMDNRLWDDRNATPATEVAGVVPLQACAAICYWTSMSFSVAKKPFASIRAK